MNTDPILVVGLSKLYIIISWYIGDAEIRLYRLETVPPDSSRRLTLLKNGIPVRIIDKRDKYHSGQCGSGIQVGSHDRLPPTLLKQQMLLFSLVLWNCTVSLAPLKSLKRLNY